MASVQLTDEELFSELKRLGASPGPVTENTRPVYLKRLKKLREEQQQRSRGVKGRNGSSVNSSSSASASGGGSGSNNGHTAAGASAFRARPAASDVTHVNSTRSPGSRSSLNEKRGDRSGKFVLGFSSDESDAEAPQKRGGLSPSSGGRRDRGSALHSARPTQESPAVGARRTTGLGLNSSGKSHLGLPESRRSTFGSALLADYRGNLSFGDSHKIDRHDGESEETDHLQEEPGSTGRTLNGSKGTYSNQGDYSDSDEEEDDDEEEERRRRLLSRRSVTKFTSTPYKSVREKLTDHGSGAVGLDMASAQGEDDELIGSFLKTSRYTSVNGEEESRSGREAAASSGSLSSGLRARYSTYNSLASPYTFNHSNHTGSNHNYSHKRKATGPEDELLEQFKRDEVSGPGGFSAHYLSMFLLTAACLFFLLLGLMYLRMRGSGASDAVPGKCSYNPQVPKYIERFDFITKDCLYSALRNVCELEYPFPNHLLKHILPTL